MAWLILIALIAVLLIVDLVVMRGRGGVMDGREAAIASVVWITIALIFGGALFVFGSSGQGESYLAGYLIEKTLSLDNVFVFLLVFGALGVPTADRHRLLTYGVAMALVLRGGAIVAGAALLESFSWVSFIFAALLAWTAFGMLRHRHDHQAEAKMVEGLMRRIPLKGAAAALVLIAIVDLIFAVDSVPAILAITDDTYVVFAANAFALLGLRPLFFVVEDLVSRLPELKTALALVLAFIAVKLVLGELVGKIGPEISLPVVALILTGGVVASLRKKAQA
ncbi:Putative membrane-bound redox modulator Alx [Paraconexibacter sp. AEG42_29]|uniref:Membrane-bound redox modulator Alx n=1 Tax=Paraconexibacter sp. AEG42_29 TaxID=2997339 RepID=A0AAU7AYW1_9ACTN